MKKSAFLVIGAVFCLSAAAYARSGMMGIARGGLGFLYPDFNTFGAYPGTANVAPDPAEIARNRGFGVQAEGGITDIGQLQYGNASAAYANGRIGIGAFDNRLGTHLTTSGQYDDTAGVAIGGTMWQNRIALGLGYQRDISAGTSDNGTLNGAFTYKQGEKGIGFGLDVSSDFPKTGASTQSATVAVGYSMMRNNSFEFFAALNDFKNTNNDSAGIALNLGSPFVYFGGLAEYNRLDADYTVAARLGFVLAQAVDFSFFGEKTLVTGAATLYGATFRATF